jgi:hypothetical protein
LADLKSYHASYQQDVTGNLDGKPFESHTHIELTRAAGQSDFTRELQGTDEQTSYFRVIAQGKAVYRWNSLDESCQGEAGDLLSGETLEPAKLLPLVLQTSKVGNETVNQIPTIHYHFDQNALPVTEPKPSISGEIWLAEQGGYLVKYILNAAMPTQTTGVGLEAAQSWTYELSQVNSIDTVPLPAGCMAVPVGIPVMPDATDVSRGSGFMAYGTASSASQVVDLYFDQLGSLGWTAKQEKPGGELKIPLGLKFTNGDQVLTINVDNAEAGGLDVTLMIYNPKEQVAASTPPTNPTAGGTSTPSEPLPTIDASTSGLPEDISLYPGATDLQKIPGTQGIAFDAPDLPDQVDAFYNQEMVASGWTLLNETKGEATIIQLWQKANRMTSINISTKDAKTNVMILIISQ